MTLNFYVEVSYCQWILMKLKNGLGNDLAIKYNNYLNGFELCSEMEYFKHQASALMTNFKMAAPIDLLKCIHKQNLQDIYPNIEIALRIFLSHYFSNNC